MQRDRVPILFSFLVLIIALVIFLPVHVVPPVAGQEEQTWADVKTFDGIVYFLPVNGRLIRRYDLSAETWMANLVLSYEPEAFAVDETGLFIAGGKTIRHYDLTGSGESTIYTAPADIHFVGLTENHLYLAYQVDYNEGYIESLDRAGYSLTHSYKLPFPWDNIRDLVVSEDGSQLFAINNSYSSEEELLSIVVSPEGQIGPIQEVYFTYSFPAGRRVYSNAAGDQVLTANGTVFDAADLSPIFSAAGQLDDAAFEGEKIVLLRGKVLYRLDTRYREIGRRNLNKAAERIVLYNNFVYSFRPDGEVQRVSFGSIMPLSPAPPVDPEGLNFTPTATVIDENGIVYLLNRDRRNIFRWSAATQSYLASIGLTGDAVNMVYWPETKQLIITYASGRATTIELNHSPLVEKPYTNFINESAHDGCISQVLHPVLLACGATYDPDGALLHVDNLLLYNGYSWDPAHRRLYGSLAERLIHWMIIPESGVFTNYTYDAPIPAWPEDYYTYHPVIVRPDGGIMAIGYGHLLLGDTLELQRILPEQFTDAVWLDKTIYTVRSDGDSNRVVRWTYDNKPSAARFVPGAIHGYFAWEDSIVLVTAFGGRLLHTVLDADLNVLYQSRTGQVFIPGVYHAYCADFFDDFSDPGSGWAIRDDEIIRSEYTQGVFRVSIKQGGYYSFFVAPACARDSYEVSADFRWSGPVGNSYGLIFGLTGDRNRFYLFEVNTDLGLYRVINYWNGEFKVLLGPNSASDIRPGNAVNRLAVRMVEAGGGKIDVDLLINGSLVNIMRDFPRQTETGIVVSGYRDGSPTSVDIDNFSVRELNRPGRLCCGLADEGPPPFMRSHFSMMNEAAVGHWPIPIPSGLPEK